MAHITPKGYVRFTVDGRLRLEHCVVWEEHFGPIPTGYQVHHINGDKVDNRIENLQLVDTTTHKRLHSGCKLLDGVWWKRCNVCGVYKPLDTDNFYFSARGWPHYSRCKPCHISIVVKAKQERRARQAA